MIRYGEDPRCLSNARTLSEFLARLRSVLRNCARVLADQGHVAVLMGDGKQAGEYLGLPFRTLNAAAAENLWLACPEIIRFSHGATSSAKQYRTSFIPRLSGQSPPKEKLTVRIDAELAMQYRDWSWQCRCQLGELVERAMRDYRQRSIAGSVSHRLHEASCRFLPRPWTPTQENG